MDTIHVVLAVYDPKGTYSRHAGVVMTSIFERTKSSVRVHILHDETLMDGNRARFNETARMYGQSVEFHDVSPFVARLSEEALQQARGGHSLGALFRLLAPSVLSVDKIIYLDSDVVVNLDIRELWEVSIANHSLAGVLDIPSRRFSASAFGKKLMGCDPKNYINSGVLVMNLSRIREKHDLFRESAQWYRRCRPYSSLVDQNFLNACFREDITFLEARFNNGNATGDNSDNSILHAMGVAKPWNGIVGSAIDRFYWRIYTKTPWGRLLPESLADALIDAVKVSHFTHRHTAQCYKNIFFRLKKDVLQNNLFMVVWFIWKEFCYRVKSSMK
ncbi:hypothetical protein AGMMS50276_07040 [Synergistales bacterium]|nr:hypothetical protein AGMMS50276_07040 [Synergistales bacterium]